jgi:hypothetical protein
MCRDWLNTKDPYVQYTYEISEKERQLLKLFGTFFNDAYAYWQPPKNLNILKRRPLWLKQKRMPAEKVNFNAV